jgi:hypothetical protein
MAVGQPRQGRAPIQVDHLSGRASQRFNVGGGARRHDSSIPQCDRLGDGIAGVHRENPSVDEHEIGRKYIMTCHGGEPPFER